MNSDKLNTLNKLSYISEEYKIIPLSDDFINSRCSIKFKCLITNTIFESKIGQILTIYSNKSFLNRRLPIEVKIKRELLLKYNIIILDNFINTKEELLLKNVKTNEIWKQSIHHFKEHGKPLLRQTKPEKEIEDFLIKNQISFEKEKTFSFCLSPKNNTLPFDFYLPDFNLIIEFDGPTHSKPIFGEETFKRIQRHDFIKNQFCFNNNINILRISDAKQINKILINNLNLK